MASEALMEKPADKSGALLPGLTLAGRDKTHAAARVLERPYKADDYLEETFNRMVFNYDSIAAIIQNAPNTFGKLLARNIEKSDYSFTSRAGGSLAFRKHRHNSLHAPSLRMILHFDALLETAQQIASTAWGRH